MTSSTAVRPTDELELVLALRVGDENAFTKLVHQYQSAMLQVALTYVGSRAIAEEVVQEAWLGVRTAPTRATPVTGTCELVTRRTRTSFGPIDGRFPKSRRSRI